MAVSRLHVNAGLSIPGTSEVHHHHAMDIENQAQCEAAIFTVSAPVGLDP